MDGLSVSASVSERKQAVYWFSVVFSHLLGLLRPATYCTERELNTACRRMLDLLDLCLYFNAESLFDESDTEDAAPGTDLNQRLLHHSYFWKFLDICFFLSHKLR